jgi:hypothetical protein
VKNAQNQASADRQARSFGLWVGGVLCAIALLLFWRGRMGRAEIFGIVGVVLVVCGAVSPFLLRWPSVWWLAFARALGYVNARILLTVIFGLIFVPLSIAWRLMRRDPLGLDRGRFSGWLPYPATRQDRSHYSRMY